MRPSAVTSPFAVSESGNDWVDWRKDQPLSSLRNAIQTECRSVLDDHIDTQANGTSALHLPYNIQIKRPQYNAVLDRFSNARKRSGTFSNWQT